MSARGGRDPQPDPGGFGGYARSVLSRGYNAVLGIGYVAHGPGWIELELPWPDPAREDGALILPGFIDIGCSLAIIAREDCVRPQATLDLRVDFFGPALRRGGVIRARSECYLVTDTFAFVRCRAADLESGTPVAGAQSVFTLQTAPA